MEKRMKTIDKTYIFRGKKVRGYPLLEKEHTAKGK